MPAKHLPRCEIIPPSSEILDVVIYNAHVSGKEAGRMNMKKEEKESYIAFK